jgi:hypothetical protein
MTPKEKAEELFLSFCKHIGSNCEHDSYCAEPDCKLNGIVFCKVDKSTAKQCALIAVGEILNGFSKILPSSRDYWEEVKKELSNL